MSSLACLYALLLHLYPRRFYTAFGDEMRDVFGAALAQAKAGGALAAGASLAREALDLPGSLWREHRRAWQARRKSQSTRRHVNTMGDSFCGDHSPAHAGIGDVRMRKWGGLASILLAIASVVAPAIYLTGNLESPTGPFNYDLADFLYGPLWAAALVGSVLALRDRLGTAAPRRMNMALLAAVGAAMLMVAVASIRSANRHYHLTHPELHLENSTTVLLVWTTLLAGLTSAGLHFFGWVQVLIAWSGWTSRRLPRALCLLSLVAGVVFWFTHRLPGAHDSDPTVFAVVTSTWLGIVLWKGEKSGTSAPDAVREEQGLPGVTAVVED